MTYHVVAALSALQVIAWVGWFICEIIIHSLNRDSDAGSYLQLLAEQSMAVYLYEGIILAGTLAALHMAAAIKTRAARVASFIVQAFATLAWLWELYFVIPTLYDHTNPSNLFCTAFTGGTGALYTPELSICRLAMAVASFAIIMEAFQCLITVYAFAQVFIPPKLEDGTRKEVIEEDDAEVATVVAANPAGYESITSGIRTWSSLSLVLTFFSLMGYAIFMFSLIEVVRRAGFQVGQNFSEYKTMQLTMLGDFILSWNYRQLALTLVFALAASGYAAFRHNRGVTAGALFLTTVTTLQWWSFIIFSGRFLRTYQNAAAQIADNNADGSSVAVSGYIRLDAQRAMYAGACVILAGETLRCFVLLARYFTFVPVTRNGVIPTYVRGALATANAIPVLLFAFEAVTTLVWWVFQFVDESNTRVFDDVPGAQGAYTPYYVPMQNVVSETLFIWQTLYILAVFIPELFSERTKTLASKQAALAVNVTVICAYFLLSWPWAYAGAQKSSSYFETGAPTPITVQATPFNFIQWQGFCDQTNENMGHDNCYFMQGAAILSFITALGFVLLAVWQLLRILTILPTRGQVAAIDGSIIDALPPTVGVQKLLGLNSALLLIGLLIWALTAIDAGSGYWGWSAYTFGQMPSSAGWQAPLGPTDGTTYYTAYNSTWQTLLAYTYSVAFPDLVLIGFTVWAASELAANPVMANWHAWRSLVTGLSGILFSFLLPQLILVCRYVNWYGGGLGAIGKGIASGFIILCVGEFFVYGSALLNQRAPLIALPAAINNTAAPVQTRETTRTATNNGVAERPLEDVVVVQNTKGLEPVGTRTTTTGQYAA